MRPTIRVQNLIIRGGETTGLKQLEEYILSPDHGVAAKGSKHHAVHPSRLSAWISMGCLSMRWVYRELIERGQNANSSLVLELLWRDYFRFMFKKHGKQFLGSQELGTDQVEMALNQDELFEKWKTGTTGTAQIDASMRQLNATGYMSNHNRQIVAGFLADQLKVDWTRGAAYFEEKLIDYSPASNWGNWAFVAGGGAHPRDSRYFLAGKPAEELDTRSEFISTWLDDIYEDDNAFAPVLPA